MKINQWAHGFSFLNIACMSMEKKFINSPYSRKYGTLEYISMHMYMYEYTHMYTYTHVRKFV